MRFSFGYLLRRSNGREPTESNNGVSWYGSCPLEGLPYAVLGTHISDYYVSRQASDGGWYEQYTPGSYSGY